MSPVGDYLTAARQSMAAGQAEACFARDEATGLALALPERPPGRWTRFQAWLSRSFLTLAAQPELQPAKQRVERYLMQKSLTAAALNGFVRELHLAYRSEIGDLCARTLARSGPRLSARSVVAMVDLADQTKASCCGANAQRIEAFLNGDGPAGESGLDRVHAARAGGMCEGSGRCLDEQGKAFVADYVRRACVALPDYARRALTIAQIEQAAREAITAHSEAAYRAVTRTLDEDLAAREAVRKAGQAVLDRQQAAWERALISVVAEALDQKSPDSVLSLSVAAVVRQYQLKALPSATLTGIVAQVTEAVQREIPALRQRYGAGAAMPAPWLLQELRDRVAVELDARLKAIGEIQSDTAFTEEQTARLLRFAASHRVDTPQLAAFKALTEKIVAVMKAMAASGLGVKTGAALGEFLVELHRAQATASPGEHGRLGVETIDDISLTRELCALAVDEIDDESSEALLKLCAGAQGRQFAERLRRTPDEGETDKSGAVLQVFGGLLDALAERSGVASERRAELVEWVLNSDKGRER